MDDFFVATLVEINGEWPEQYVKIRLVNGQELPLFDQGAVSNNEMLGKKLKVSASIYLCSTIKEFRVEKISPDKCIVFGNYHRVIPLGEIVKLSRSRDVVGFDEGVLDVGVAKFHFYLKSKRFKFKKGDFIKMYDYYSTPLPGPNFVGVVGFTLRLDSAELLLDNERNSQ